MSSSNKAALTGELVHQIIQSEYAFEGKLYSAEPVIVNQADNLVSKVDVIKSDGTIQEIKSVSMHELISMKSPRQEHIVQLIYYITELGKKHGELLYVAREAIGMRKLFKVTIEGDVEELSDISTSFMQIKNAAIGPAGFAKTQSAFIHSIASQVSNTELKNQYLEKLKEFESLQKRKNKAIRLHDLKESIRQAKASTYESDFNTVSTGNARGLAGLFKKLFTDFGSPYDGKKIKSASNFVKGVEKETNSDKRVRALVLDSNRTKRIKKVQTNFTLPKHKRRLSEAFSEVKPITRIAPPTPTEVIQTTQKEVNLESNIVNKRKELTPASIDRINSRRHLGRGLKPRLPVFQPQSPIKLARQSKDNFSILRPILDELKQEVDFIVGDDQKFLTRKLERARARALDKLRKSNLGPEAQTVLMQRFTEFVNAYGEKSRRRIEKRIAKKAKSLAPPAPLTTLEALKKASNLELNKDTANSLREVQRKNVPSRSVALDIESAFAYKESGKYTPIHEIALRESATPTGIELDDIGKALKETKSTIIRSHLLDEAATNRILKARHLSELSDLIPKSSLDELKQIALRSGAKTELGSPDVLAYLKQEAKGQIVGFGQLDEFEKFSFRKRFKAERFIKTSNIGQYISSKKTMYEALSSNLESAARAGGGQLRITGHNIMGHDLDTIREMAKVYGIKSPVDQPHYYFEDTLKGAQGQKFWNKVMSDSIAGKGGAGSVYESLFKINEYGRKEGIKKLGNVLAAAGFVTQEQLAKHAHKAEFDTAMSFIFDSFQNRVLSSKNSEEITNKMVRNWVDMALNVDASGPSPELNHNATSWAKDFTDKGTIRANLNKKESIPNPIGASKLSGRVHNLTQMVPKKAMPYVSEMFDVFEGAAQTFKESSFKTRSFLGELSLATSQTVNKPKTLTGLLLGLTTVAVAGNSIFGGSYKASYNQIPGRRQANEFSGKDEVYNTIEGMSHQSMYTKAMRNIFTDFGSGYKGRVGSGFLELFISKITPKMQKYKVPSPVSTLKKQVISTQDNIVKESRKEILRQNMQRKFRESPVIKNRKKRIEFDDIRYTNQVRMPEVDAGLVFRAYKNRIGHKVM